VTALVTSDSTARLSPSEGPGSRIDSRDSYLFSFAVGALVFFAFLWPSELPIAMFWHGVARPAIGDTYVLLVHASLMIPVAVSLLVIGKARIPSGAGNWSWFAATCTAYLGIGVAPVIISGVTGVDTAWVYQEFAFGFVAPIVFIAATLSLPLAAQQRIWVAFYAGWVVFLAVSAIVLVTAWREAIVATRGFASAPFAQQLIMWRFTLGQPWNFYGVFMGNANKLSNNLIVFLLMSVPLLDLDGRIRTRRKMLFSFWVMGVVTVIVMFSRAALLLLPVVLLASGVLREIPRTPRRFAVAAIVAGIAILPIFAPELFDYLFAAKIVEDSDADPLGTYNDRIAQWSQLLGYFSEHTRQALLGLGTSGYGALFFRQPELGTHNTFLDLWAEAGILSPLLLCVTIVSVAGQVFVGAKSARRKLVTGAGLVSVVLLMTREHSFSYLYVTSLGGLCFTVLMYATIVPDRRANSGRDAERSSERPGGPL
jgi:O-antigen ligase